MNMPPGFLNRDAALLFNPPPPTPNAHQAQVIQPVQQMQNMAVNMDSSMRQAVPAAQQMTKDREMMDNTQAAMANEYLNMMKNGYHEMAGVQTNPNSGIHQFSAAMNASGRTAQQIASSAMGMG